MNRGLCKLGSVYLCNTIKCAITKLPCVGLPVDINTPYQMSINELATDVQVKEQECLIYFVFSLVTVEPVHECLRVGTDGFPSNDFE